MKKTLMALVATTMLAGFSAPSFAGINPANIDESTSAANIYKIIDEKVAEGENAGVVSIFAWANVNGEIYSVSLNELRKHGRNAGKAFGEIVGQEVEADFVEQYTAGFEAGADAVVEAMPSASEVQIVEIVRTVVRTEVMEVIRDASDMQIADAITAATAGIEAAARVGYITQEAADMLVAQAEANVDLTTDNAAAIAEALVLSGTQYNNAAAIFAAGEAAGVASVDVSDSSAAYIRGHAAGVASATSGMVDITSDNAGVIANALMYDGVQYADSAAVYAAGHAAGVASVAQDFTQADLDAEFDRGVASVDVTSDNNDVDVLAAARAGWTDAAGVTAAENVARAAGFDAGVASVDQLISQSDVDDAVNAAVAASQAYTDNAGNTQSGTSQEAYTAGFDDGVDSVSSGFGGRTCTIGCSS